MIQSMKLRGILIGVLSLLASTAGAASLAPLGDVNQIVTGAVHACALSRSGTVSCWGSNVIGQLGVGEDSSITVRSTPVPVTGLAGVRLLATGYYHTCAITAERGVQCWGLNDGGQSGDATLRYSRGSPTPVQGLSGPVTALATGSNHSCALHEGGRVSCWGDNSQGQLGDGSTVTTRATAAEVVGLGAAATVIEAGSQHSCAVLVDGSVKCWGRNDFGQLGDNSSSNRPRPVAVLGLPGPVRALGMSAVSTCAVTSTGAVYCWGPQYPLLAFEGGSLIARAYPGFATGFVAIDGGDHFYCALSSAGTVKCFGENAFGQFGNGPIDGSLGRDTTLDLAPDSIQISAGGGQTCARSSAGGAQCWGDNRFGQLGIDATSLRLVPTPVFGLDSGIAAVGIGNYHGCALSSAGAVKCWGINATGEAAGRLSLTPVAVPGLAAGVRALDVGSNSSCAITAERRAKCWGVNYAGQLGIGTPIDTSPPIDVVGLGNVDVLAVGVGDSHACALLSGGAVKCWGDNRYGQLGDSSFESRGTAVTTVGLGSPIRAIATGYFHTCAITEGGAMKCWGLNATGQLGDGSRVNRSTPTDVVGLSSGVVAAGPGGMHSCAVLAGGAVKCWGASYFGLLLGDGSEQDRNLPGDVPALRAGVVGISTALFSTCVRLDSGAMKCWGSSDGALGDNTGLSHPTPSDVAGLNRGVTASDNGYGLGGHACAVVNGAAKCWGENTFAQLGDGSTHGVPSAQTVLVDAQSRQIAVVTANANDSSSTARSDASGQFVVFASRASNLIEGDSNGRADVFRSDRETGRVLRVSVDNRGAQIAGDSIEPAISADGRLVVFVAPDAGVAKLLGESKAAEAVRRKTTGFGVYLRNLLNSSTQRIGSALAAGVGTRPQIAANGTAVVFTAAVSDANQGLMGQNNVFSVPLLRAGDLVSSGSAVCVTCKAVSAAGIGSSENSNGESRDAVISADGRYVVFESLAKNAVLGSASACAAGSTEVRLRDLVTGLLQQIGPPSGAAAPACGVSGSGNPSIDFSGQRIAFESDAGLAASDLNQASDVYLWQANSSDLRRLSEGPTGVDGLAASTTPMISGDGLTVAFASAATNLDVDFADNNGRTDVHAVSTVSGETVLRLSRTSTGAEANGASGFPALSFDGARLAFESGASNFGAGVLGGQLGVFQRSNPSAKRTRSATWFVPSESGWGLTVFDQGNLLVPAWFTYDLDGEPTWFLVAGAFPQPDGSFRGDLLRLTGVPYDRISGPAVESTTPIGSATLRYSGDDVLNFDYDAQGTRQSKLMKAFPFGSRTFACGASPSATRASASNYSDVWTGAVSNAGWGLTIFHVDDSLFAGWYTYDSDREAVFFVLTTTRQADGSFAGSISRTRNGTPFPQINGSPASPGTETIGSTVLRFESGERASFTTTINGQTQTQSIVRLLIGNRPTQCLSDSVAP